MAYGSDITPVLYVCVMYTFQFTSVRCNHLKLATALLGMASWHTSLFSTLTSLTALILYIHLYFLASTHSVTFMIVVQLAQLFTSMVSYSRFRVIIGEEKVVAFVHADALWDICCGVGDAAQSSTFSDEEVWSTIALNTQMILCLRVDSVDIVSLIAKAVCGTRLLNGIHLDLICTNLCTCIYEYNIT